ncbi:hypothetical protein GCM10029976_090290 [Kribbella albertanoniae]
MKVLLAAVLVVSAVGIPGQAVAAGIDQPLTVSGQAAAMQKDFGLTEQQMNARLKSETDAAKLLPVAQKAAGPSTAVPGTTPPARNWSSGWPVRAGRTPYGRLVSKRSRYRRRPPYWTSRRTPSTSWLGSPCRLL